VNGFFRMIPGCWFVWVRSDFNLFFCVIVVVGWLYNWSLICIWDEVGLGLAFFSFLSFMCFGCCCVILFCIEV